MRAWPETSPRRRDHRDHRAFTLLELMIALVISAILISGMTGAIMISTRTAELAVGSTIGTAASREIVEQVTRDLHFATGFTERTDTAATFTVPDRDGDGQPETIRYEWSGVPGVSAGPLTRAYNNGSVTTIADDVKDFSFLYDYRTIVGVPPQPAEDAGTPLLMVVVDADALSDQDLARIALLESWGYAPAPTSATAAPADFAAAVLAADVAYVAAQNGSAALGTKLRDAAIGVVCEELELHDEFGFSQNTELIAATDTFEIADNTHFITEPYATGDLVICTSNQPLNALRTVSAGFVTLGHVRIPGTRPVLGVINPGGDLYGGGTAAGARVQLPWGRSGFDIAALNDDGRTLLARSLTWAAGGGAAAGPGTFGYDTAFTTQVSGVDGIQIATKATLTEAGSVTSLTAYVGGAPHGVRYAIYADSGGEPGVLLVESSDENTSVADAWLTIPVPVTPLPAGDYWLALALDRSSHRYYHDAPGETRYHNYDAEKWGFEPAWGGSDASYPISVSIYATYDPD